MPVVRTDGRAGGQSVCGHVITKFSRMGSLPHFFTHGAPLRALRARELRDDVTCPFKASGLFTSIITHEDINFISVASHERRVLVGYPERRNSTQRYREQNGKLFSTVFPKYDIAITSAVDDMSVR